MTTNIAPKIFNKFMQRLDLGYEAMYDLTGNTPINGAKIIIREGLAECGTDYAQHAHQSEGIICWPPNHNGSILRIIQKEEGNNWWFAGTMHELGHVFEYFGLRLWAVEGGASYLAWLSIKKNNGAIYEMLPMNPHDDIYEGFFDNIEIVEHNVWNGYEQRYGDCAYFDEPLKYHWYKNLLTHTNASNGSFINSRQDDIVFLLNPIFEEFGWDEGWGCLQKIFHSYFDNSYAPLEYAGTGDQIKLADFIDRCTYFIGKDIKNLWLPNTLKLYNQELIPPTTPYVVVSPLYPKVGDEITFSVYNCPSNKQYLVFLNNGKGWMSKNINLSEGDNIKVLYDYKVKYSDIKQTFVAVVRGLCVPGEDEWSNGTNAVPSVNTFVDFEYDLNYVDNMFTFSTVELSAPVLFSEKIYIEINKCVSNVWSNVASGNVNMNSVGYGNFSFIQTAIQLNPLGDYIKIDIYKDETCQELITQQFISPVAFEF